MTTEFVAVSVGPRPGAGRYEHSNNNNGRGGCGNPSLGVSARQRRSIGSQSTQSASAAGLSGHLAETRGRDHNGITWQQLEGGAISMTNSEFKARLAQIVRGQQPSKDAEILYRKPLRPDWNQRLAARKIKKGGRQ